MNKPSRRELLIVRFSLVAALVVGIGGYYLYKKFGDRPSFAVKFETTAGNFVINFHSGWAPRGVKRVKQLVEAGFYDDCRFFRVLPGFVVQWGMNGDPQFNEQWMKKVIADDPVIKSNLRGFVTFAFPGRPNSRGTQLFVNLRDNPDLDKQGFPPVGQVVEGLDVIESIYSGYGEEPVQETIVAGGNVYLKQEFPQLDYIRKATIISGR